MIDDKLTRLELEVVRINNLSKAFDNAFSSAIRAKKFGINLTSIVEELENILREDQKCGAYMVGLVNGALDTILHRMPILKQTSQKSRKNTIKLLLQRRGKVRELVQLVLNKHRRRKEQIEWIEEIFGTELSKCFATDCLVLINYKDDVQELHVYFGGINAPTGHGHGHYIFKLINGSVRLRRVRDPANF